MRRSQIFCGWLCGRRGTRANCNLTHGTVRRPPDTPERRHIRADAPRVYRARGGWTANIAKPRRKLRARDAETVFVWVCYEPWTEHGRCCCNVWKFRGRLFAHLVNVMVHIGPTVVGAVAAAYGSPAVGTLVKMAGDQTVAGIPKLSGVPILAGVPRSSIELNPENRPFRFRSKFF